MDSIKNKMKSIIYIYVPILLSSCSKYSFEKELIDFSENSCDFTKGNSCEINFTKFLNSEIDSILIYEAGTNVNDISKSLGINYNNNKVIEDETKRVIFLYKGKIVKEGELRNDRVSFIGNYNSSYYFCKSIRTPILTVERVVEEVDNNTYNYYVMSSEAK